MNVVFHVARSPVSSSATIVPVPSRPEARIKVRNVTVRWDSWKISVQEIAVHVGPQKLFGPWLCSQPLALPSIADSTLWRWFGSVIVNRDRTSPGGPNGWSAGIAPRYVTVNV